MPPPPAPSSVSQLPSQAPRRRQEPFGSVTERSARSTFHGQGAIYAAVPASPRSKSTVANREPLRRAETPVPRLQARATNSNNFERSTETLANRPYVTAPQCESSNEVVRKGFCGVDHELVRIGDSVASIPASPSSHGTRSRKEVPSIKILQHEDRKKRRREDRGILAPRVSQPIIKTIIHIHPVALSDELHEYISLMPPNRIAIADKTSSSRGPQQRSSQVSKLG